MTKHVVTFLAVAIIAYLIFSQGKPAVTALMTTDISTLLKNPNEFDGRSVTVTGIVVRGAAIFGVGGYTIEQGGADILVMTSHGTPDLGSQVTVSGTFKQALRLNNLQYPVILEKK